MAVEIVTYCYSTLFFLLVIKSSSVHIIPDVTIQAYKPGGIRAYIPGVPDIKSFEFHGKINQYIQPDDAGGDIYGIADHASGNGWWIIEHPNRRLTIGDVIYYNYALVSSKDRKYQLFNLTHRVGELITKYKYGKPRDTTPQVRTILPPPLLECEPTVTRIRDGRACAGQVLFEDNFDTLKEDIWQVEHYIPNTHPEYPFVSYQRHMVSSKDNKLRIKVNIQEYENGFTSNSITSGILDLTDRCTRPTEKCFERASGANILPPVVTGRVFTKHFAFTYGIVNIRAKLPQGDWLYPEILLEPLEKFYGLKDLRSGLLKIACARGNKELYEGSSDYGNKILYGGPVIIPQCPDAFQAKKTSSDGSYWGDDYHLYTLHWAPDLIILSVDQLEWMRIDTSTSYLFGQLPPTCRSNLPSPPATGSNLGPFDQLFHLTFGVAAGGVSEFKDNLYTGGNEPKPWNNQARRARLNFYQRQSTWYSSWDHPELLIDYVKVIAL